MAYNLFRGILNSKIPYAISISFKRCCNQAILKSNIRDAKEEISKLSTLFVPGRRGSEMYQIVKPFVDINYIADNLANIKLSCDHRGIKLDLDHVISVAKEWSSMKRDFLALIKKEQEYLSEITRLTALDSKHEAEVMGEKRQQLLEKMLLEKNKIYDIEDNFMPLLQKVPHILHFRTPLQFDVADICQDSPNINIDIKSHTEIAKNLSALEFSKNPSISYFLSGKLSQLDFAIHMYYLEKMCSLDFIPLSCADFCKSFIIEAIGLDPYSNEDCIKLKSKSSAEVGQKLHLVGGASLETFCAYLTNMNFSESTLPLKYFSMGRRYNAEYRNSKFHDLFSVVQSNNVHYLLLSNQSFKNEYDLMLHAILECYTELKVPFRTVNISAKNLKITESRKTQIELWSPALKDYVPVGYISEHEDFLSKRLQITYGEQHAKEGYCNIIEGAAVSTPTLIGCIIENFQSKDSDFNIPDVLQKYI